MIGFMDQAERLVKDFSEWLEIFEVMHVGVI